MANKQKKPMTMEELKNKPKKIIIISGFVIFFIVIVFKFIGWQAEQKLKKKEQEIMLSKKSVKVTDNSVLALDKQAAIENKINDAKDMIKKNQKKQKELELKDKSRMAELNELKSQLDKLSEENKSLKSVQQKKEEENAKKIKMVEDSIVKKMLTLEEKIKKSNTYNGIKLPPLSMVNIDTKKKQSPLNLKDKKAEPKIEEKPVVMYSFFSASESDGKVKIVNRNIISDSEDGGEDDSENKKEIPLMLRIGALDAISLNGVKAPVQAGQATSPGDTYPVFFKIGSKSLVSNNGSQSLENCIAIGSAKGNGNSERVMIHIVKLSCTDPSGTLRYESDTKGDGINAYVMGEDNLLGMPGVKEDVSAALLYKSIMAGFLQGVANAFSNVPTYVGITGDTSGSPAQSFGEGFAQGASGGLGGLASYYMELAKTIMPVISIKAGRRVTIFFSTDAEMKPIPYRSVFINTPFEYTATEKQLKKFNKPTMKLSKARRGKE